MSNTEHYDPYSACYVQGILRGCVGCRVLDDGNCPFPEETENLITEEELTELYTVERSKEVE